MDSGDEVTATADQFEGVDPETQLAELRAEVREIHGKIDNMLAVVDSVAKEVAPALDGLMNSPIAKMIIGK